MLYVQMTTRRNFLKGAATVSAATVAPVLSASAQSADATGKSATAKFKLNYAPHFGMFKNHAGKDLIDQIKFAADQGFTAWEDNGMMKREVAIQERIAKAISDLDMTMGVFVANAEWKEPIYNSGKSEDWETLRSIMKKSVETAKRVNAKWCTVVPGTWNHGITPELQTARVVDSLRAMAEICEPSGLVMVLEPLNYRNHPNMFLTRVPQAFQICKAVNSPSCKILNDLYHQQISEGDLISNMNEAWSEIAYFQVGDNPGRKEPYTGEINYQNVFKHIASKNFTGIIGMEHGLSGKGKEGEIKLIDAYRKADSF